MLEVALLTLLSVLAAIAFGVLHRREPGPAALWTWGCVAIFGSALCTFLVDQVSGITIVGRSLGVAYQAMLLAGALAYAGREVPRSLIPLGLTLGAVAGVAVLGGYPLLSQAIGVVFGPAAVVMAAYFVIQVTRNSPPTGSQRALGPAFLVLAALMTFTALWVPSGDAVPAEIFGAWAIAIPLSLALQVAASSDRTERALRAVSSELEQRVGDRTSELASSLARLESEIAERRATERALRESEKRYRTISELSSDYAFSYLMAPDGTRSVEWASGALKRITGYELEELTGNRWVALADGSNRTRITRAMMSGEQVADDFPIRTKSGEKRWIGFRIGEHQRLEDGSIRVIGVARDVTERRRAEEERRRLDQHLQEVQRLESLGVLAGGIAHDFNNMLTVILGNVRLARLDLESGGSPNDRLARIHSAAEHASALTEQMLTYSGKGSLDLRRLNLSELAHEMLDLLRASVTEKVNVEPELVEPLPFVEGDPTQLRQVLLNLVTNASDSIVGRSGTVRVSTGVVEADTHYLFDTYGAPTPEPGSYVFVEISDTGPGMDPAISARIFEPFFTTKETGRGLGLAAVLGIVRSHHGVIKIESRRGEGTVFRVLLPVSTPIAARHAEPSPRRLRAGGRGQILVVDDDEAVLEVTQEFLQRSDFDVVTATRGDEAIEIFRAAEDGFDAVVLDLSMPGIGGEEVLRTMHELRPSQPVVMASGFADELGSDRARALGVSEVLVKPFEPEALVEAVARAANPVPFDLEDSSSTS